MEGEGYLIAELMELHTHFDSCPRWWKERLFKRQYEEIIRYLIKRHRETHCPAEFYISKLFLKFDLPEEELNSEFPLEERWRTHSNMSTAKNNEMKGITLPTIKKVGNMGQLRACLEDSYHILGGGGR